MIDFAGWSHVETSSLPKPEPTVIWDGFHVLSTAAHGKCPYLALKDVHEDKNGYDGLGENLDRPE